MRKHRFLIGLPFFLLSVACGGGDRYAIVSGGENTVYRLDKRTGEVFLVKGDRSWRVLSPAAEEVPRADLRNVQLLGLEKGDLDTESYVRLYNGSDIEFTEITFRIRTRLYRTRVNLQPFATDVVEIEITPDDAPPKQMVIVSAKGIRRET